MQRHVPTTKIDHFRAKREVQVKEGRTLSHGFLLPGVAKARTGKCSTNPHDSGLQQISAHRKI
jgi:hypothetical protein